MSSNPTETRALDAALAFFHGPDPRWKEGLTAAEVDQFRNAMAGAIRAYRKAIGNPFDRREEDPAA